MDKTKIPWIVQDGSIFSRDKYRMKIDTNQVIHVQRSIAFNVGDVAAHIVRVHNESLNEQSKSTSAG